MRVKVNKEVCIGCGFCQATEPSIFEIEDDGLAAAKNEEISKEIEENVIDALEGCPTGAIEEIQDESKESDIDNEED